MLKGIFTLTLYEKFLRKGLCDEHYKEIEEEASSEDCSSQKRELQRKALTFIRLLVLDPAMFSPPWVSQNLLKLRSRLDCSSESEKGNMSSTENFILFDSILVFIVCYFSKVCCIGALFLNKVKAVITTKNLKLQVFQYILEKSQLDEMDMSLIYPFLENNFKDFDEDLIHECCDASIFFLRGYTKRMTLKFLIEQAEIEMKNSLKCHELYMIDIVSDVMDCAVSDVEECTVSDIEECSVVDELNKECTDDEHTTYSATLIEAFSTDASEQSKTDCTISDSLISESTLEKCTEEQILLFLEEFLSSRGPLKIDDPLLECALTDFHVEADIIIAGHGGIENFLKCDVRFAVVEHMYVCVAKDIDSTLDLCNKSSLLVDTECNELLEKNLPNNLGIEENTTSENLEISLSNDMVESETNFPISSMSTLSTDEEKSVCFWNERHSPLVPIVSNSNQSLLVDDSTVIKSVPCDNKTIQINLNEFCPELLKNSEFHSDNVESKINVSSENANCNCINQSLTSHSIANSMKEMLRMYLHNHSKDRAFIDAELKPYAVIKLPEVQTRLTQTKKQEVSRGTLKTDEEFRNMKNLLADLVQDRNKLIEANNLKEEKCAAYKAVIRKLKEDQINAIQCLTEKEKEYTLLSHKAVKATLDAGTIAKANVHITSQLATVYKDNQLLKAEISGLILHSENLIRTIKELKDEKEKLETEVYTYAEKEFLRQSAENRVIELLDIIEKLKKENFELTERAERAEGKLELHERKNKISLEGLNVSETPNSSPQVLMPDSAFNSASHLWPDRTKFEVAPEAKMPVFYSNAHFLSNSAPLLINPPVIKEAVSCASSAPIDALKFHSEFLKQETSADPFILSPTNINVLPEITAPIMPNPFVQNDVSASELIKSQPKRSENNANEATVIDSFALPNTSFEDSFVSAPSTEMDHISTKSPDYNSSELRYSTDGESIKEPVSKKNSGIQNKKSYEKLLTKLEIKYPNYTQKQLIAFVTEVKKKRGKLSGLTLECIINQVGAIIESKEKETENIFKIAEAETKSQFFEEKPGIMNFDFACESIQRNTGNDSVLIPRLWGAGSSEFARGVFGECVICFEKMDQYSAYKADCEHYFHLKCIRDWLDKKGNCPICRVLLLLPEDYPPVTQSK